MNNDAKWKKDWHDGLRAMAESAFPKKCANCGRIYNTAEEFLAETVAISEQKSGLKQSIDDDEVTVIVEAYRNCPCGSTLMDFFGDRRDESEAGRARRARFGELLDFLIDSGLDATVARTELIKVVHGEKSNLLAKIKPPK